MFEIINKRWWNVWNMNFYTEFLEDLIRSVKLQNYVIIWLGKNTQLFSLQEIIQMFKFSGIISIKCVTTTSMKSTILDKIEYYERLNW